jgi:hypothetical protein
MSGAPTETASALLAQWPQCLATHLDLYEALGWAGREPIPSDRIARAQQAAGLGDIATFIAVFYGFERRYVGTFDDAHAELAIRRAVYSVVYLGKDPGSVEGLLAAWLPLLATSDWEPGVRYKMAHTFQGMVMSLLYDTEYVAYADDHAPFDWYGNLNDCSDAVRAELMAPAGLAPLEHPAFPPSDILQGHCNLPGGVSREELAAFYVSLGYEF